MIKKIRKNHVTKTKKGSSPFRELKIGAKITALIGVVILTFLFVIGYFMFQFINTSNHMEKINTHNETKATIINIVTLLDEQGLYVDEYLEFGSSGRYDDIKRRGDMIFNEIDSIQDNEDIKVWLTPVKSYYVKYMDLFENELKPSIENNDPSAQAIYTKMNEHIRNLRINLTNMGHVEIESYKSYYEKVKDNIRQSLWLSTVGIFISFILSISVAITVNRLITKPIKKISETMKLIAKGDLNVKPLNLKSNDEIGDLSQSVNFMIENFKEIILKLNEYSSNLFHASKELNMNFNEIKQANQENTKDITDIGENLETQTQKTVESSDYISGVVEKIYDITSSTKEVSIFSEKAKEESQKGNTLLSSVVNQMGTIQSTVDHFKSTLENLDRRSKEVSKIVEIITDIAEQTNLLALNASIEAARAGVHGRGFAVVAEEVKGLANEVTTSASQITHLIEAIQTDSSKSLQSMQTVTDEVNSGIDVVNKTGTTFKIISDYSNQLPAEFKTVERATEEMLKEIEFISNAIKEVSDFSLQSTSSTQRVVSTSEEQHQSIEEMTNYTEDLEKTSLELKEIVDQFNLD